jgi:hypothetical protein
MIPMGQPILVGHHSEGRHRRDLRRIDDGYRKGFAALEAAKVAERRASIAEESRAISSDDPNALDKLREKLATIEADRERGVKLNRAQRAKDPIGALSALGVKNPAALLASAKACQLSDQIVPGYRLRNLASEARRVQSRITILERQAARPETPPETIGSVEIREEDNRVALYFPDKPPAEIRTALKSNGFRWAPTVGAWQRMASSHAWYVARQIAGKISQGGT